MVSILSSCERECVLDVSMGAAGMGVVLNSVIRRKCTFVERDTQHSVTLPQCALLKQIKEALAAF